MCGPLAAVVAGFKVREPALRDPELYICLGRRHIAFHASVPANHEPRIELSLNWIYIEKQTV